MGFDLSSTAPSISRFQHEFFTENVQACIGSANPVRVLAEQELEQENDELFLGAMLESMRGM